MKVNSNLNSHYYNYVAAMIKLTIDETTPKTQAELAAIAAVKRVYAKLNDFEKKVVKGVFSLNDTIADNVYSYANNSDEADLDTVWTIIKTFERNVAEARGLI